MFGLILAAEAAKQDNPILPTTPELFWGAVSFGALYLLVRFVLLPPVKKTMNDRAERIRSDLDAADVARASVGSAAGEVHDELASVRNDAANVVDTARAEAEAQRAEIMGVAEAEVATMQADADAEIRAARETALAGVRPQVAELATNAAGRVMQRDVDLTAARSVVDRFLDSPN